MDDNKDSAASWVALAVVSFSLFLEVGLVKSFSVLLHDMTEQFDTYNWIIGGSISIIIGWGCLIGLFANVVVSRIGAQTSLVNCGAVSSIGLIVCACATNILTLLVGLFMTGSVYLQEIIAIGVIPDYFEKYYKLAVSIYSACSGLGIIIMPVLTQVCLDGYGWRGTLALLAGISLHFIPCGAMLRQHKRKPPNDALALLGFSKTEGKSYNGSTYHSTNHQHNFWQSLRSPFFTNMSFWTQILIPSFVWGYTFSGWLIYIVLFALSNGTSLRQASVIGTCGGIGLTLIRIALPLLHTLMTYKQLMYISSIITGISLGLTNVFTSFQGMIAMSVIFGAGFGILGAELYVAAKEIGIHNQSAYLGTVAWMNLVHGFAAIASGFLTGFLYDMTGSFEISFTTLAAISMVTAISLGFEDILNVFIIRQADPIGK